LGGGNVFLGVNQGLRSTTVIMKIGLVGRARRGLAMGPNEAAGYLAVVLLAFATGTWTLKLALGLAPALWEAILGSSKRRNGRVLTLAKRYRSFGIIRNLGPHRTPGFRCTSVFRYNQPSWETPRSPIEGILRVTVMAQKSRCRFSG